MSFDNLGLDARILDAVRSMGYASPTPIQEQAIPAIVAGRDVVGCARAGHTQAATNWFSPLLALRPRLRPHGQVHRHADSRAGDPDRRGGSSRLQGDAPPHRCCLRRRGLRAAEASIASRRRRSHRHAGSPARSVAGATLDLSHVEVLVLDEADRMLDMGFAPDVKRIMALMPGKRQNLLFSATMPTEILKLIDSTLDNPAHISVAPVTTPIETIAQSIYPVGGQQKSDLLTSLITDHGLERVLVFTRTKHRADRVARVLDRSGIRSAAIHGNRSQAQRQKALDGFKRGHSVCWSRQISLLEASTSTASLTSSTTTSPAPPRTTSTASAGPRVPARCAFSLVSPEEHDRSRRYRDDRSGPGLRVLRAWCRTPTARRSLPSDGVARPRRRPQGRAGGGARRRRMNSGNPGPARAH